MASIYTPNYEERFVTPGKGIRYDKGVGPLVLKGAVWHWTANTAKDAGAEAHFSYWNGSAQYGAHYVVDDKKIIHAVPDNEVLWHAGPSTLYTSFIKNKFPKGANSSCIGIELCVNSDGNWETTYINAVNLGAFLCVNYGWTPDENFVRHYDCTKKDCPRMMSPYVTGGDAAWAKFKADVNKKLKGEGEAAIFTDIINHWARNNIEYLNSLGIVKGDGSGKFNPEGVVTRAEMATVVARALKIIKEGKLT